MAFKTSEMHCSVAIVISFNNVNIVLAMVKILIQMVRFEFKICSRLYKSCWRLLSYTLAAEGLSVNLGSIACPLAVRMREAEGQSHA